MEDLIKPADAVTLLDPDESLKGSQILKSLLLNGPINGPVGNGYEIVQDLGKKSEVQVISSHNADEVSGETKASDPPKTIAYEDAAIVDSNVTIAHDNAEIVHHGIQGEPIIKPDADSRRRSDSDGGRKTRSRKSARDETASVATDDDMVSPQPPTSTPDDINEETSVEATSSPETTGRKTRNTRTKSALRQQLRMKRGQKLAADISADGQSAAPLALLELLSANVETEPIMTAVPTPVLKSPNVSSAKSTTKAPACEKAQWALGAMLWAKVAGHPWWPCIVGCDPFKQIYIRNKGQRKQYHVFYCGEEGERGWVHESHLVPYDGKPAFDQFCQEMITRHRSKRHLFEVAPSRLRAWNSAVSSADAAYALTPDERLQKLTAAFQVLSPPVSSSTTPITSPVQKKRRRVSSVETPGGDPKPLSKRRRKIHDGDAATEKCRAETETGAGALGVLAPASRKRSSTTASEECNAKCESLGAEHSGPPSGFDCGSLVLIEPDSNPVLPVPFASDKIDVMSGEAVPEIRSTEKSDAKLIADKENLSMETAGHVKSARRRKKHSVGGKGENLPPNANAAGNRSRYRARRRIESVGSGTDALEPSSISKRDKIRKVELDADDVDNDAEKPSREVSPLLSGDESLGHVPEIQQLHSTCLSKKEYVCHVCEGFSSETAPVVQCQGPCMGTFHVKCLESPPPQDQESFTCNECTTGIHCCFACKQTGPDTVRCSVPHCGRFYHNHCLEQLPLTRLEKRRIICPLHTCVSCSIKSDKNLGNTRGRYFRCVRCPTAYHSGDHCIAAGSVNLGGLNIICSNHFERSKVKRRMRHVNVAWCFQCSKGGTLLCCDSCPASFHAQCLETSPAEGSWNCDDCLNGRRPLYGEIVWAKAGFYRWWPGEICHPRNVPTNIQLMRHMIGEFPVRFFGTNDYLWTHKGRVFQFQEGDKGHRNNQSKDFEARFQKAILEANEAYRLWVSTKEKKVEKKLEKKPARYKPVKANVPIGNVEIRKLPPLSEIPRCGCRSDMENPCGPDSDCINRLMMYECHPAVCAAGSECGNRRFQLREDVDSVPFRTEKRGWGLKTNVDIVKGRFVHEYVGDLIDEAECKRRLEDYHQNDVTNYYMLTIDRNRIIDAGPKGNNSRFMNHSCQPNCETQKWTVNGDVRIGLFAVDDIKAGTELTFNYNLDCLGNDKTVCRCGAPVCSGFLGDRPKAAINSEKRVKKKRRRQKVTFEHEDECYRCHRGGELVLCDKRKCPKAYHRHCLKLTQTPKGKWLCPWHHCDLPKCGKRARKLCVLCPNSYCNHHLDGKIFQLSDLRLVCFEHKDLIASDGGISLKNARRRSSASPRKSSSVGIAADAPQKEENASAPKRKDAAGVKNVQSESSSVDAVVDKTDVESKSQAARQTDVETKSQVAGKADAETKSQAAGKTDVETKSQAAGKTGVEAKSPAAGKTGIEAKSRAAGKTGVEAKSQAAGKTGVEAKSQAAGKTDVETKSQAAGKTGVEAKLRAAGKTGVESKSQAAEIETPSCGSRTRLKRKASEKDTSCHASLTNGHVVNGLSKSLAKQLCGEKSELDGN